MADDEDAIYIDVIPRVDDGAADSAVSKLKDKFKDVAGNIGPEFMDALNNSGVLEELGKKMGSAVTNAVGSDVREMSSAIGVDLEDAIGKVINKDWSGLGVSLGKGLGGKLTDVLGIKDLLGPDGLDGVIDKFNTVADTMKSLKGGDLGSALHGANALTGGALQPIADLHDQIKQSVGDTKELIEDTVGAGWLGSKAAGATRLFAEAAAPVAGSLALTGPVEDHLNQIPWVQEHTELPGSGGDWFKKPFRELGGYIMHPSRLAGDAPYDKNGNFTGAAAPQPNSTDRLYSSVFGSDMSGTGGGGGKTTANVAEVQTNSAVVSAGSVTIGGNISIPGIGGGGGSGGGGGGRTTSTGVAAAGGDSGGMASLYSGGGGTTIAKGHYASGGILPGDSPGHDNMIGVLPGGMVGLEGGEGVLNPNAMKMPGVADLVSSLNKHYDEGTTNVGGDPNNQTLSMPPTQGNQDSSGGKTPITQQPTGHGSGVGVSGGGLIGMAEQAGVMAAAIGGFGGGGVAAQIAMQETNLAIQKSGQIAAALASAPFETFGLTGGQMGAPQVNPMGGWPGKLLGGLIGQQTNLPNIAGATQPPKQPEKEKPGEDPGNGVPPDGPAGTKDDPMHVNVTNTPPGPPQNAATSAANFTAASSLTTV